MNRQDKPIPSSSLVMKHQNTHKHLDRVGFAVLSLCFHVTAIGQEAQMTSGAQLPHSCFTAASKAPSSWRSPREGRQNSLASLVCFRRAASPYQSTHLVSHSAC